MEVRPVEACDFDAIHIKVGVAVFSTFFAVHHFWREAKIVPVVTDTFQPLKGSFVTAIAIWGAPTAGTSNIPVACRVPLIDCCLLHGKIAE
ncbi:hypothetical protein K3729_17805 (plasmid) [Rhodobacteraceae bacterium S2214]|nr:hypothetical protein K3729_17805 [Rhodobacteraceae bacterium S2214]